MTNEVPFQSKSSAIINETFKAAPWYISIISNINNNLLLIISLYITFTLHFSVPCSVSWRLYLTSSLQVSGPGRCGGGSGSSSTCSCERTIKTNSTNMFVSNTAGHLLIEHLYNEPSESGFLQRFGFTIFFLILRTVLVSAEQLCDWLGHLSVKQTHLDIFFLNPWCLFIGRLIVLDLCVKRRWAEITFHLFGVVMKRIHFCLLISFNHL